MQILPRSIRVWKSGCARCNIALTLPRTWRRLEAQEELRTMKQQQRHDGFSMIELLVVIAIILVVSAIAIPYVFTAMTSVRLRSSGSDLAGLLQRARAEAVERNRALPVACVPAYPNCNIVYVDMTGTGGGAYNPTYPTISFSGNTTFTTAPPSNFVPVGYVANPPTTQPWFNARGLPCLVPGGGGPANCATPNGFVFYLSAQPPVGNPIYVAVEITPAGRTRVYSYCQGANPANGDWCP